MSEHFDVDAGDDLRLHVAASGNGPALVLLHGFTGSCQTWNFLRPSLDSHYRIVAIDLPGHGRSSSPSDPGRYSLERFAADLATVLDKLELERAAVLGYSMGGRAALRFAIARPDRTSALVLESTSPGISDAAEREERAAGDRELADFIERQGIEAFVSRWERLPLWESQRALPDASRKSLREQRLSNNPLGLANSLRGASVGADLEVLDKAGSITAPALILAGELDTRYVELGRRLARAIPKAELEIVAGCGHAAHLERPEAFTTAVADFLARIRAA